MTQFEKGMIIKMSGLSVKKENGVFEINSPWEKDCSVYKLKKDGTRIKNGLDIFSYKKIEQYGKVITVDQIPAATSEINKQLKERKENEIVVSFESTDKKDYANKSYIKVVQPIKTTSSIYSIPRNSIFQLSIIETSSNIVWKRVGKRGEVLASEGTFHIMSWSEKSMNNLFEKGYIEIVERVETVRKDIENNDTVNEKAEQVESVEVVEVVEVETVEEVTPVTEEKEQIQVKSITFEWSESNQIKDNTVVNTFSEANELIKSVSLEMRENSEQGYRKTSFIIEWVDGRTHSGRIDIEQKHFSQNNPLGDHVKYFYEMLACVRKPYNHTWEEHKNNLKYIYKLDEQGIEEVKQVLETYLLEDSLKGESLPESLPYEVVEEVAATIENKTIQDEIIDTVEVETVITETTEESQTEAQKQTSGITYKLNEEKNGVEIYFESKPSEEVRNVLKSNGFRWSKYSKCWYSKQSEETLSLAKQLAGEESAISITESVKENQENHITATAKTSYTYPEIEIDDIESYIVDQKLQDQEHDGNWLMRKNKPDRTKEIQDYFTQLTNEVKEIIQTTDNSYLIYQLKKTLQYYKKHYFNNFVARLKNRAECPSWLVTGRDGRNRSRDQKYNNRYDKLMSEWIELDKDFKSRINSLKNKIRKDKEEVLKTQLQEELKQPLPKLTFKTITKDFDLYGRGTTVKTRFYECEGYSIAKVWGAFRVFETATGKEIYSTKSAGTLQDAKAFVQLQIKKEKLLQVV